MENNTLRCSYVIDDTQRGRWNVENGEIQSNTKNEFQLNFEMGKFVNFFWIHDTAARIVLLDYIWLHLGNSHFYFPYKNFLYFQHAAARSNFTLTWFFELSPEVFNVIGNLIKWMKLACLAVDLN